MSFGLYSCFALPLTPSSRPLNSIGVPYYRETLLSALPNSSISDVGAPPPKFSSNDLAHLTKASFGFYGPNRRRAHRNQIEDTRSADKTSLAIRAPKFLSEKARDSAKSSLAEAVIEAQVDHAAAALGTTELESLKPDVPALYQNVEIQFSKYGVDDFDFEFYNKTRYAGLENHIANSYANSLLQVLHFTPLVRNLALQHAATDCLSEKCLLCELGFLSDMLQKTEGSSCHASNLLKCLANHPPGKLPDMCPQVMNKLANILKHPGLGSSRKILDTARSTRTCKISLGSCCKPWPMTTGPSHPLRRPWKR